MEKSNFFVHRPIVAMVIAIVIVIVGLVFITQLPTEQYPDIAPPMVSVSGYYTGASAINVEQSVAVPIEQQVNGVDNMIYMKSVNANDGSMSLQITFDIGTDPDMNTVFTQNRVSSATPKLPESVKQYGLKTEKSFSFPILVITLSADDDRYSQEFLGNYMAINIRDILSREPGVGRVDLLGSSEYSMRIWVKPDRLASLDVTIPEIVNAIRSQSVIVPGGKFGAEPAPPGTEFTYTVRLPERLKSEEEFTDIVVRVNENGSQIKIRDLATVELGVESYNAYTRLDGKSAGMFMIYQAPGSNAVEIAKNLRERMDELSKTFPEGVNYTVSLDSTKAITTGIDEIFETLIIALILVILVVFLFIQDWRATLIPTVAIPVSLIGAFIVFPLLGFSINVLSLLGLVLAIGIVVDDAIVVVEAVQVNIQNGMNAIDATNKAMREVTAPIVATTLVLVAVFVPVAAMGGITGRLYQQFAITVAVSVIFSAVNALTLSPALCALLLRKPKPYKGLVGKFFAGFNRVFDKTSDSYTIFAGHFARKMKRGAIYILIMVVALVFVGRGVPGGFIPEEDQGYFLVNIQLPNAASLQRSDVVTREIEEILMQFEETQYVTSAAGYSLLSGALSTNTAFMFVSLTDWSERNRTALEVVRAVNKKLAGVVEAQAVAMGPPAIPGLGSGSGFSIVLQDKSGDTPEYLAEQSMQFIRAASARPEIANIFTTYSASTPQRYIDVNRDMILKAGVNLNDLYTTIGAFLGGAYVNDFNQFGRLYKTYVQAQPEYRINEEQINLFFVKNNQGKSIPLSAFVDVKKISGPDFTNRFNLYRSAELTGSPAPGYSSDQALDALEEVAAQVLPAGMGYEWTNMSYQERKASGTGSIVFVFSLLFVFLILAAQYESWSLPFSILLGTPFALLGALLALLVARLFSESYVNNVFAQISLVLLIAMAAKNAILIIEFANLKFQEGLSLYDSAMAASRLRFRPILMTAFSFILGILPLLVASGAGSEARKVMGMTLFGGMLVATILGVLFYPLLYILIGKLAGYEKKRDKLTAEKQIIKS